MTIIQYKLCRRFIRESWIINDVSEDGTDSYPHNVIRYAKAPKYAKLNIDSLLESL